MLRSRSKVSQRLGTAIQQVFLLPHEPLKLRLDIHFEAHLSILDSVASDRQQKCRKLQHQTAVYSRVCRADQWIRGGFRSTESPSFSSLRIRIGYEPEGRQFDSVRAHHKINSLGGGDAIQPFINL